MKLVLDDLLLELVVTLERYILYCLSNLFRFRQGSKAVDAHMQSIQQTAKLKSQLQ